MRPGTGRLLVAADDRSPADSGVAVLRRRCGATTLRRAVGCCRCRRRRQRASVHRCRGRGGRLPGRGRTASRGHLGPNLDGSARDTWPQPSLRSRSWWLTGIARLADGVEQAQAEAVLRGAAAIAQRYPDSHKNASVALHTFRGTNPRDRGNLNALALVPAICRSRSS